MRDLQLIVAVAFTAVVLVLVLGLPLVVENELVVPAPNSGWAIVHAILVGTGKFFVFFVPVLGVLGAVLPGPTRPAAHASA